MVLYFLSCSSSCQTDTCIIEKNYKCSVDVVYMEKQSNFSLVARHVQLNFCDVNCCCCEIKTIGSFHKVLKERLKMDCHPLIGGFQAT